MARKHKRLLTILGSLGVLGVAVTFMLMAFSENLLYFQTPSDLEKNPFPLYKTFRLGGLVKEGSVVREGRRVRFIVTDTKSEIPVNYEGILPDLFEEGKGVVTEGELTAPRKFKASQVLAKHDENYMPPPLEKAIKINRRAKVS